MTPQTVPSNPRNGDGQENEAGLQLKGLLGDSVFERALHVLHPFEGDKALAAAAVGVLQAGVQFEAAGLVHNELGAAFSLDPAVKDIQDVFLGAVFGVEELVEVLGAAHLERLGNHDGPGDDGEDNEEGDDGLGFGRGLP